MDQAAVKNYVEEFWKKHAGSSTADCFPAWYLHHVKEVPVNVAFQNTSEPEDHVGQNNYDFGVDAFNLSQVDSHYVLSLVQAKYSSSLNYISSGFRNLIKFLPVLNNILNRNDANINKQNKVIINLRRELNSLTNDELNKLRLEFLVIHISDENDDIIQHKSTKNRNDLTTAAENELPNYEFQIKIEGPSKWGHENIVRPPEWDILKILGRKTSVGVNGKYNHMYLGVGYLSELVELYERRRYHLFSKNVRYFIKSKSNVDLGPSAKMKETLKNICLPLQIDAVDPGIFAFYHNGVTIFSKDIEDYDPEQNKIKLRDPFVLNGCQTIKTAYLFFTDYKNNPKFDKTIWENITIPIRIISSVNEDLIRLVTINNNRQNAISYDALRSNDPVQLELEAAFKDRKIIYERQKGAFENIEDTNPEVFSTIYENTCGRRINIVELGRTIAAATGEMSHALSPSHIFESDSVYNKIFSPKRLQSKVLLTFLQNLHDVMPLVVKMNLGLEKIKNGPSPSRLSYYALALLIAYIEEKEDIKFIKMFGTKLWGRNKVIRDELLKKLDNRHSKIQNILKTQFMTLTDGKTESLMNAYKKATLEFERSIDIFTLTKKLDEELPIDID